MYCWEAAKKSQATITELLLYRKSTGVILRDASPALERLCTNGPFEDCQIVWMFVKQRRTHSWSSYLPGKKYIYPTAKIVKSLHNYVPSQWKRFWVGIYALCIGLRSQMLYPNRRIKICQVKMFVKQRRTHGWSSYLPRKNIFIPQQKSSNLYIIMFQVSENVSEYVFMHTAVACVHKCFTREGHLKSAKSDCLSNSVEHSGEAVTCSLH